MALKIDMANAHDKVDGPSFVQISQPMYFTINLSILFMICFSSANFSILVNGYAFGNFKSSRGIRQKNPISLALFTIYFDLFS